MKSWLACLMLAALASSALALEPGEDDFRYVSELANEGYTPFAASAAGNASFGMTNGRNLYLCFIADTIEAQAARQSVLLGELSGEDPSRNVPNIPVICVLTQ